MTTSFYQVKQVSLGCPYPTRCGTGLSKVLRSTLQSKEKDFAHESIFYRRILS